MGFEVLAALATIPGRPLETVLRSLRPQVDRLHVYCNHYDEPPAIVRELADAWICDPANARGSAGKFAWVEQWDGLYASCDDDLLYPPDYIARMRDECAMFECRAIVTTHGRSLVPTARTFFDYIDGSRTLGATSGGWTNYPAVGGMLTHTDLGLPTITSPSVEGAEVAVWAQGAGVPMWVIPHPEGWIRAAQEDRGPTVWAEESRLGFQRRNAVIQRVPEWRVFQV